MCFFVAEIGGFFGPFVVDYLVDVMGGFLAGAIFMSSLGVIILGLTYPLKIVSIAVEDES